MEKDRDQLTPEEPEDVANHGSAESHGVHGAEREDGMMQEEPDLPDADLEAWAEQTETGADAT